jgi:hypothetical protein
VWYQFPSAKEVIIPFEDARKYAEQIEKSNTGTLNAGYFDILKLFSNNKGSWQCEAGVFSDQNRIPVVAILGHFNHGKTTLLDALGASDICSGEAHGITQVGAVKVGDQQLNKQWHRDCNDVL